LFAVRLGIGHVTAHRSSRQGEVALAGGGGASYGGGSQGGYRGGSQGYMVLMPMEPSVGSFTGAPFEGPFCNL
jgi:hypothetical protein